MGGERRPSSPSPLEKKKHLPWTTEESKKGGEHILTPEKNRLVSRRNVNYLLEKDVPSGECGVSHAQRPALLPEKRKSSVNLSTQKLRLKGPIKEGLSEGDEGKRRMARVEREKEGRVQAIFEKKVSVTYGGRRLSNEGSL